MGKLTQKQLHHYFLNDIAPFVESVTNTDEKPLVITLKPPYCCTIKAYLFNCTCPPGGRVIDEYKVQLILPGQKRGSRGYFDDTDGNISLIIGYADYLDNPENGVYVLFETDIHREFAYSANIQIYLRQILQTTSKDVVVYVKQNHETVVLSKREYLAEALKKRLDVDLKILLDEPVESNVDKD